MILRGLLSTADQKLNLYFNNAQWSLNCLLLLSFKDRNTSQTIKRKEKRSHGSTSIATTKTTTVQKVAFYSRYRMKYYVGIGIILRVLGLALVSENL